VERIRQSVTAGPPRRKDYIVKDGEIVHYRFNV